MRCRAIAIATPPVVVDARPQLELHLFRAKAAKILRPFARIVGCWRSSTHHTMCRPHFLWQMLCPCSSHSALVTARRLYSPSCMRTTACTIERLPQTLLAPHALLPRTTLQQRDPMLALQTLAHIHTHTHTHTCAANLLPPRQAAITGSCDRQQRKTGAWGMMAARAWIHCCVPRQERWLPAFVLPHMRSHTCAISHTQLPILDGNPLRDQCGR